MTHKIVRKLTYEGDLSWIIHTLKRGSIPSNGTTFLGDHKISSEAIAHDGTVFNVGHEPSAYFVGEPPLEELTDYEFLDRFANEIRRRVESRDSFDRTFDPMEIRPEGELALLYFVLQSHMEYHRAEQERLERVAKERAAKNEKKI
jgi:hypothetical protein